MSAVRARALRYVLHCDARMGGGEEKGWRRWHVTLRDGEMVMLLGVLTGVLTLLDLLFNTCFALCPTFGVRLQPTCQDIDCQMLALRYDKSRYC
jgi:hypothetical protein